MLQWSCSEAQAEQREDMLRNQLYAAGRYDCCACTWPSSSADFPAYAPGVSTNVTIGSPNLFA